VFDFVEVLSSLNAFEHYTRAVGRLPQVAKNDVFWFTFPLDCASFCTF
jgi:hypothetical protein